MSSCWHLDCCCKLYNRQFISGVPERTDLCDRRARLLWFILGTLTVLGISTFFIVNYVLSGKIIVYEPSDISSGVPFPSITICSNYLPSDSISSWNGVQVTSNNFFLKSCQVYNIIDPTLCNNYSVSSCNSSVSNLTSPCGRNCLSFSLSDFMAHKASDFVRIILNIGTSSASDAPYRGGFAYIHDEGPVFDTDLTNNNFMFIKSGYYHLFNIQKTVTKNQALRYWREFTNERVDYATILQSSSLDLPNSSEIAWIDISYESLRIDTYIYLNEIGFSGFLTSLGGTFSYFGSTVTLLTLMWTCCCSYCRRKGVCWGKCCPKNPYFFHEIENPSYMEEGREKFASINYDYLSLYSTEIPYHELKQET